MKKQGTQPNEPIHHKVCIIRQWRADRERKLIKGERLCIRNVLLLAKAKETPHHVWLYDHTRFFFTLTVEIKMSFKVKTSKTLSNIHTTKRVIKLKNSTDFISALYSPKTNWACAAERGVGVVGGGIVQTQQRQKNVTEEKIQRTKVNIYKTKQWPICTSRVLYKATAFCCNTELCQHFSIARVSAFYSGKRA